MRLDKTAPHEIRLTLSRRNILALLAKLANPVSARTLSIQATHPKHTPENPEFPILVFVHAEQDKDHYGDRPSPAGIVQQSADSVMQTAIDLIEQVQDYTRVSTFDDAAFEKALHQLAYLRERVADQTTIVV